MSRICRKTLSHGLRLSIYNDSEYEAVSGNVCVCRMWSTIAALHRRPRIRMQRREHRSFFTEFPEYADGECRGTCVDLNEPTRTPRRDLSFCCARIHRSRQRSPSACCSSPWRAQERPTRTPRIEDTDRPNLPCAGPIPINRLKLRQ